MEVLSLNEAEAVSEERCETGTTIHEVVLETVVEAALEMGAAVVEAVISD